MNHCDGPKSTSTGAGRTRAVGAINAADAARRAARATNPADEERYRLAAMGTPAGRAGSRPAGGAGAGRALTLAAVLIGFALAACLIWIAGGAVSRALLADTAPIDEGSPDLVADADAATGCADASGTISYRGRIYSLMRDDGGSWHFCRRSEGAAGDPLPCFDVTGEAVGFALCDDVFFVVSNDEGSHHVQSYLPSDGALPADYRSGRGDAASLELTGSVLSISLVDGGTDEIDVG